jgi:hypothetical protein
MVTAWFLCKETRRLLVSGWRVCSSSFLLNYTIPPFRNTNIQWWVRFPKERQEDKERNTVIDRHWLSAKNYIGADWRKPQTGFVCGLLKYIENISDLLVGICSK